MDRTRNFAIESKKCQEKRRTSILQRLELRVLVICISNASKRIINIKSK